MTSGVLEAAFEYGQLGWSIIPIRLAEKKPATRWKRFQRVRATEKTIRRWVGGESSYGIAVVFGEISGGLVSRDFDSMSSYEDWRLEYPQFAKAFPTVQTPRGRHVYCRASEQNVRHIRQMMGAPDGTGAIRLLDGELRVGVGCYSVVPPSQHPNGENYLWLNRPHGLQCLDLLTTGLVPDPSGTERTERTEQTEENGGQQRKTEAMEGGGLNGLPWNSEIQRAVLDTVPIGVGVRNKCVFELARTLKAIPELSTLPGMHLRPYVEIWYQQALPVIATKPFEESWIDFLKGWPRVKYPKGSEPMVEILARVEIAECPKEAAGFEQERLRRLVCLCRELQRESRDVPFFLSCRKAGEVLGVSRTTISRWLFLLLEEGLLELVRKGSAKSGQASRYRYLGAL